MSGAQDEAGNAGVDKQLQGKSNYIDWSRKFKRAAKAKDLLKYLTGEVKADLKEPVARDSVVYQDAGGKPVTRNASVAEAADDKKFAISDPGRSILNFEHAYKKWERDSQKSRDAAALLENWVCDAIAIEIEDYTTPHEAYQYVQNVYGVSDDRAREEILEKIANLKLEDCDSMTSYLNGHRQHKADLKVAGLVTYTDNQMVTNIIHGLPSKYRNFKSQYDWIRSTNPGGPPDIQFLFDRLQVEEQNQKKVAQEKTEKEKVKKKTKGLDKSEKSEKTDKSHLLCDVCEKRGHTSDTCWTAHPELMPKALKDKRNKGSKDEKFNKSKGSGRSSTLAAVTAADIDKFKEFLTRAEASGMSLFPYTSKTPTDSDVQTADESSGQQGSGRLGGDGHSGGSADGERVDDFLCNKSAAIALATGDFRSSDTWLVDSGANIHVVNDIKWLNKYHKCDVNINTINESTALQVQGGGRAKLTLLTPAGQTVQIPLSEVVYAPGARCNLLSLGLLAERAGIRGSFNNKSIVLKDADGRDVGHAEYIDGLYHLAVKSTGVTENQDSMIVPFVSREEPIVAAVDFDDPVWKWHRRMGHLGLQNLRHLLKFSTGMEITDKQIQAKLRAICPVCATTKALVRIPRDPATRHAEEPGFRIHVDSWGPYSIEGYDGTRYFVFFTDEATRFTWSARYKKRGELPTVFRQLHKHIERTRGIEIRNYRLDGEFSRGPIGTWLTKYGIGMEATTSYEHYQNGVSERANRIVRDKVAPMIQEVSIANRITTILSAKSVEILQHSSIPENLWPEAMEQAVWLKNRSPARALRKKDKKTPWEALYDIRPCLERERIWGSRAYVTIALDNPIRLHRPKLHTRRGWGGYFVGCDSESIYRIFSPEKHRVFRVGVARVEDGEGLDDEHDQPSLQDRDPLPEVDISSERDLDDEEDYDASSEDEEGDAYDFEHDGDTSDLGALFHEGNQSTRDLSQLQILDVEEESLSQDEDQLALESSEQGVLNIDELPDDHLSDGLSHDWDFYANAAFKGYGSGQPQDEESSPESEIGDMSDSGDDFDEHSPEPSTQKTAPKRLYLPDSSRCDACFRKKYICDKDFVGLPCTPCSRTGTRCIEQTRETQMLVLPENRNRLKEIRGPRADEPCRRCFQKGHRCVRDRGEKFDCNNCARNGCICNPDLTGAKRAVRKKQGKNQTRVKYEKKCSRCAQKNYACNGKFPCDRCNTPRLKKTCMSQEDKKRFKELEPCTSCISNQLFCDRKRPCGTCIEAKKFCRYKDQGGMLYRTYPVKGATWKVQRSPDMIDISDDEECSRCVSIKANCDGEKPCRKCVEYARRGRNKTCNYKLQGGIIESYVLEPFELDSEGTRVIRDGFDGSPIKPWRRSTQSKKTKTMQGSEATVIQPLQHVDSRANRLFNETFPRGNPERISTSGAGLECALNAVIGSMLAQQPWLPQPTLRDLQDVVQSVEFQVHQAAFGRSNTNYLYSDQIAAVLHFWADTYHDLNLQLGIQVEGREPQLINSEGSDRGDAIYIWIYNNNVSDILGAGVNHFEGLREPRSSHSKATKSTSKRSRMEFSDPEGSSEDEISKQLSKVDDDVEAFTGNDSDKSKHIRNRQALATGLGLTTNVYQNAEPQSYAEAMRALDAELWRKAMDEELNSLDKNMTWELADLPDSRRALTSRWVFKRKIGSDGKILKYKARLVARGFQQAEGIDYEETFAAVVKSDSFRVLFALAAVNGWNVHQMDVKTAFLNGELEEEVFMKPPPGVKFPRGKVARLRKALYGLKQAPRAWYDKFRKTLLQGGWRVSKCDPCVFVLDEKHIILALWVDDILILGANELAICQFKKSISQKFDMTDEGLSSHYLGIHIQQRPGQILLHQGQYASQILDKYNFQGVTVSKVPGDHKLQLVENDGIAAPEFKHEYQSKVGSINFLANNTRPDISFGTGYVARYASNPNQKHLDALNQVFAYVKGDPEKGILYKQAAGLNLYGHSDSNHGGEHGKSTGAYIFFIGGAPVAWKSQRQKTVALSTMDAEYIAVSEAAKEAIWLKHFINELRIPGCSINRVPIYVDNESALKLTRNPEFHARSKHIDLKYHFIREKVNDTKDIETLRVATKDNLADPLTKFLPRLTHEDLVGRSGLYSEEVAQSGGVAPSLQR